MPRARRLICPPDGEHVAGYLEIFDIPGGANEVGGNQYRVGSYGDKSTRRAKALGSMPALFTLVEDFEFRRKRKIVAVGGEAVGDDPFSYLFSLKGTISSFAIVRDIHRRTE